MKKVLLLISSIVLLSSCDITIIDEGPFDTRDIYLGRFEVEEYSQTYDLLTRYRMRIVKDADPYSNVIYLRNFYAVDIEVFGEIIGERINIPRQVSDGYIVQGSGRCELGDVHLSYSVEDGLSDSGVADFCTTVLFRD